MGAAKDGNAKLFIVKVLNLPIVTCQIVKVFIMNINARSAEPPSCFLLASRSPVSCSPTHPTPLPRAGPAAAAGLVGLAHQCHSSVLQEPFGRAPISPP